MMWLIIILAAILYSGTAVRAIEPPKPALQDEMRLLWHREQGGFLRHWLLCGDFPNPGGAGLEKDYLGEHGGEAAIQPAVGLTHRRPDGTIAAWTEQNSRDDVIDLLKAFPGRPTNDVVAYGYTVVDWPRSEKALLSVGSDDGVKIWLNGQVVLDHAVRRGVNKDEDQVEVSMKPGRNMLLIKVEQGGGGWGFCARVLSHAMLLLTPPRPLAVSVKTPVVSSPDLLTLSLGRTNAAPGLPEPMVDIEAFAPGGQRVGLIQARAGSDVWLSASRWPKGAYDIRCTATLPGGGKSVAYAMWYHGEALAAAKQLVASATSANPETQVGMVHAMLADMVLDRLGRNLDTADRGKLPSIYSPLMEWEELRMAGGKGALRSDGFVRLAYRDPVDNSPQFCRAYLPPGYTPERQWPMVVHLHGYNADNPPYVRWGVDGRHHGWADNYGVIALEPMGRYNTTFRGIGEKDVVRCIQLAKEQLSVDEDRVYLVGESMGGGGVWYVGTRHPELFAAIAPLFGGRDFHDDLTDEEAAQLSPHDRYRVEARSTFVQAESLLTTPVFVNHGDLDDLVKVEYSRYATRLMQRWGYNIRYWEHPGSGHGGFYVDDELLPWLLKQRRVANPRHVRLRAADVSTASSHWIRIEQCLDPWQLINVDAEIAAPNIIRLDTQNVGRITLSPGKALVNPLEPVQVVWNGSDIRSVNLETGSATLDAAGYSAPSGGKTPQRFGRMDDVFRTPFAIVVGTTSPDPTMQHFVQRAADQLVVYWRQWQHVTPRIYRDTALSDADAARYSLVLIGGPEENAVTRKLGSYLPLKVAPDGVTIDGRFFPAVDALAQVVYPHPQNAARYVAVLAPTSAKGMFCSDHTPGDVDFAIVDGCIPEPGDPDSKVRVAAGMFNNAWHLDDSLVEMGDAAVRYRNPQRKIPVALSTSVHAGILMLSDVLETASEGTFATMARDLSWQGRPMVLGDTTYASGIAVQTAHEPCSATYNVAGAGWKWLRATAGIEVDTSTLGQREKDNTLVQFVVRGDGRELYKSPMLHWDSAPLPIEVNIQDIKTLKLVVISGSTWHNAAQSVDWADVRLER